MKDFKETSPQFTLETLCGITPEDARRVAQALRNEAHRLEDESERACEKGFDNYGTLLWEECFLHNKLAGFFSPLG